MLPNKIMILDTETIGLEKCFVYDIGFIVAELQENGFYKPIVKSQFIIEQVYDNRELFETAYYNDKKSKYTSLMKGRNAKKIKMGYATQIITNVLKVHNIENVFAYNSSFDKKVFQFNSDYFKIKNPFETKNFVDIMGISNHFIHLLQEYAEFCITNEFIKESGYLETNAEKTYAFIKNQIDFIEEHTSLQDCEIELDILNYCIEKGFGEIKEYKKQFIKSDKDQVLTIITKNRTYDFKYKRRRNTKKGIVLE